jgi:hypothetical protein
MKIRRIALAAALIALVAALGCTSILGVTDTPSPAPDGSLMDSSVAVDGADSGAQPETGVDATTGIDATSDGHAQTDAPEQTADAQTDAPTDGGADARMEAGLVCDAGLTPCGATCVEEGTDPANCGACGRVCPGLGGGSCSNGSCQAKQITSDDVGPLQADGTYIFYATSGSSIWRVKPDGTGKMSLAPAGNAPDHMALDPNNVYWSERTSYTVRKVGKDGTGPTILADGGNVYGVTTDGTDVFWADNKGNVGEVTVGGTVLNPIATGQSQPYGITNDTGTVYFTGSNSCPSGYVAAVAKDGGVVQTIASNISGPTSVVVDNGHAYWIDGCMTGADAGVWRSDLGGENLNKTLLAQNQNKPQWVWYDTSTITLYWANQGDGTIMKVSAFSGAPVTVVSGQSSPGWVSTDAEFVYWGTPTGLYGASK